MFEENFDIGILALFSKCNACLNSENMDPDRCFGATSQYQVCYF